MIPLPHDTMTVYRFPTGHVYGPRELHLVVRNHDYPNSECLAAVGNDPDSTALEWVPIQELARRMLPVPTPGATDRQRVQLRNLGHEAADSPELTADEARQLISRAQGRLPATPAMRKKAEAAGIRVTPGMTREALKQLLDEIAADAALKEQRSRVAALVEVWRTRGAVIDDAEVQRLDAALASGKPVEDDLSEALDALEESFWDFDSAWTDLQDYTSYRWGEQQFAIALPTSWDADSAARWIDIMRAAIEVVELFDADVFERAHRRAKRAPSDEEICVAIGELFALIAQGEFDSPDGIVGLFDGLVERVVVEAEHHTVMQELAASQQRASNAPPAEPDRFNDSPQGGGLLARLARFLRGE
jgi:hypothetical protein